MAHRWGGVGLAVDGGGVAGSGRQGTTASERLPANTPPFCAARLLLCVLKLKRPLGKTKTNFKYFKSCSFTVTAR